MTALVSAGPEASTGGLHMLLEMSTHMMLPQQRERIRNRTGGKLEGLLTTFLCRRAATQPFDRVIDEPALRLLRHMGRTGWTQVAETLLSSPEGQKRRAGLNAFKRDVGMWP